MIFQTLANGYELDDAFDRLDFERIHDWLSNTYWSPSVPRERVEHAAQHSSLVIGAYKDTLQVGYLRVISDKTTFAYLCDVYVDEAHRKRGIAKAMIQFALNHPEYQGLRRWLLATADAHDVYGSVGFTPLPAPERWMTYKP